jgi:hypothetical protein
MNIEQAKKMLWPDSTERPTQLKNLRIKEVSSVDRGAGEGAKVVLMKRVAAKDPVQDFLRAEKKKRKKAKKAKNRIPHATLAPNEPHPLVKYAGIAKAAAAAVEAGKTETPREEFYKAMMARAAKKALPGETVEKALSRLLLANDPKTSALLKAQRLAVIPEPAAAPVIKSASSATARMNALAEEHRNAEIALGKMCSTAQAFTKVYTARENIELKKLYVAEQMARVG